MVDLALSMVPRGAAGEFAVAAVDAMIDEYAQYAHHTSSLAAVLARVRAERTELAQEHARLIGARDNLAAEQEQLIANRNMLAAERDRRIAERDVLAIERDGLLRSTSWRLSRPIRIAGGWWRGASPRGGTDS